jgi:sortase A
MLRLVRIFAWTMIWSGTIILGYVAFQVYGTDLLNQQGQAEARAELPAILDQRAQAVATTTTSTTSSTTADPEQPEPEPEPGPELVVEPPVSEGEAFAALRIPAIEVEQVIYEGVDRETLKLGPGHIPWTSLPGQPGNAVLSGHRTTYGRPFFDLDQLQLGDVIEVETAIGISVYTVRDREIVTPTDVWVTEPREGSWLTLTTCNPKFSARERLIIFAELTDGPNFEYVQAA